MYLHMKVNGNGHLLMSACTRKCVCVFVRVCECVHVHRQTHSLEWKGRAIAGDFRLWVTQTSESVKQGETDLVKEPDCCYSTYEQNSAAVVSGVWLLPYLHSALITSIGGVKMRKPGAHYKASCAFLSICFILFLLQFNFPVFSSQFKY